MPTTPRDVRGVSATTRAAAVSLKFRDRLRVEFDGRFRDAFLRISREFDRLPTRAWNELRRDPTRNDRPWGRLLRTIDEAVRADAPIEPMLELPALLEAYIRIRFEQHQLPANSAQIEAEENFPVAHPIPLRRVA